MTRTAGSDIEYQKEYHAAYKRGLMRKKLNERIAFAESKLAAETDRAIRGKIKMVIRQHKARLKVVDYAERLSGFKPRGNRWYNHSKKGA